MPDEPQLSAAATEERHQGESFLYLVVRVCRSYQTAASRDLTVTVLLEEKEEYLLKLYIGVVEAVIRWCNEEWL